MIEFDGLECLQHPLREGRGVIVLGPHLGNWELLGMYLATIGDLVALYEPLAFKKLIGWCIVAGSRPAANWSYVGHRQARAVCSRGRIPEFCQTRYPRMKMRVLTLPLWCALLYGLFGQ